MIKYVFIVFIFCTFNLEMYSQQEEVKECLRLVADGRVEDAKIRLPELLAKYPDDAGVKFLHGVVLEDGALALGIYKDIVEKYPKSEWSDDVYFRIVQYYAITGDTIDAKKYLNDFKKNYPGSEYITLASNAVKLAVEKHLKNGNHEVVSEVHAINEENEIAVKIPEKEKKVKIENVPDKKLTDKGSFSLQVGIYSTQTAAKNEAAKYSKLRLVANVMPKKIGNETMYAVIIGEYKNKKLAENAKPLVAKHCNCIPLIIEK